MLGHCYTVQAQNITGQFLTSSDGSNVFHRLFMQWGYAFSQMQKFEQSFEAFMAVMIQVQGLQGCNAM